MATTEEIKHLAKLSRLSILPKDMQKLMQDFDSILAYIGQLNELDIPEQSSPEIPPLRNVFRDDDNSVEDTTGAEKLIKAFPKSSKSALVVKKIITNE